MFRRLRKILLLAAVLLVVAITTLVVLAKHYEPEVKAALVGAINEQLDAPVSVRDMDLTLIARFPMAGLRLHDVLAMEKRSDGQAADTLLFARELFLEFSIWGLFRKDHTIERIHGDRVTLRPGLDGNGRENYLVWKQDSSATGDGTVDLRRVSVDRLDLRYRDDRSQLEVAAHSSNMSLTGRFGEGLNTLRLEGDLTLRHWDQGETRHVGERQAQLRLDLEFGGEEGVFRIPHGTVDLGDAPLEVALALTGTERERTVDLRANGLGLPLDRVLELLPEAMHAQLGHYVVKGTGDIALRYTGPMDAPALSVGAKVTGGRLKEKRSGAVLTDVRGEVAIELNARGDLQRLLISGLEARSGGGSFAAEWDSKGLTNAPLKASLRADMALADLLRIARIDTLEQVSGRVRADASVEGRLRDVADFRVADLKTLKISGNASLRDATLKLKGIRHRVEHLDADLALQGNDARVNIPKAVIQGNAMALRGDLRDLVPYLLFNDQKLAIQAEFSSPRIDLAALLTDERSAISKADIRPYVLSLPAMIDLDLRARVDQLVFEDFEASAINGSLHLKDRMLRVAPVTFNTARGAVLGSLELDARPGGGAYFPLAIDATCQAIDIKALFREFQDFGQDFIGHRHLSGTAQARISLRAPLKPSFALDMDRLLCTIDIIVDDGGIKDHKPLLEIADHLRKNKLVSPFVDTKALRDRLADVRFARLENRIEIRDGAVRIPAMEVRSNTLDIRLSGTHWFDDRIDHHLDFRLGDLFRLGKPAKDEFGPIIDDGTGMRIFLHMYGTANEPRFANDRAMASQRRRDQFQQEKDELRSILREELGLFKGRDDTKTDKPATPGDTPRFEVEWNDGRAPGEADAGKGEKPRRGLGKLLDKAKEPEEKERFKVED